jgi:hypothetical protein
MSSRIDVLYSEDRSRQNWSMNRPIPIPIRPTSTASRSRTIWRRQSLGKESKRVGSLKTPIYATRAMSGIIVSIPNIPLMLRKTRFSNSVRIGSGSILVSIASSLRTRFSKATRERDAHQSAIRGQITRSTHLRKKGASRKRNSVVSKAKYQGILSFVHPGKCLTHVRSRFLEQRVNPSSQWWATLLVLG